MASRSAERSCVMSRERERERERDRCGVHAQRVCMMVRGSRTIVVRVRAAVYKYVGETSLPTSHSTLIYTLTASSANSWVASAAMSRKSPRMEKVGCRKVAGRLRSTKKWPTHAQRYALVSCRSTGRS